MPPSGKLSDEEIEILGSWINPAHLAGTQSRAERRLPNHTEQRAWWSFQPVKKPTVPTVKDKAWPRTDIDRFLLAGMEAKGLKPAPPADRRTLIRRAFYDLTGLLLHLKK